MASVTPAQLQRVCGMSWAAIVAGEGKVLSTLERCSAKKKAVHWSGEDECRVYVQDPDAEGYDRLDRSMPEARTSGGKTWTYELWPWRRGELNEDSIIVDGQVLGPRVTFSPTATEDGHLLPKVIFGKLAFKFIQGEEDKWGFSIGPKQCPDFFKTGPGKKYVGSAGLKEVIDEALDTIKTGERFPMTKETCHLRCSHISAIENFSRLYEEAAAAESAVGMNPYASVFIPKTRGGDDWGRIMVPVDSDLLENKTNTLVRKKTHTAQPIVSWGHGTAWEL